MNDTDRVKGVLFESLNLVNCIDIVLVDVEIDKLDKWSKFGFRVLGLETVISPTRRNA